MDFREQLIKSVETQHKLELLLNSQDNLDIIKTRPFEHYLSYLLKRLEREKIKRIIRLNKDVRLCVTRFIAGNPWNVPFLDAYKDSLPKCLGPMVQMIRSGNQLQYRYVLSILKLTTPISFVGKIDTKPITTPGVDFDPEEFRPFISKFIKDKGWKMSITTNESNLEHLSTKSGPNGQALVTSLLDLFAMPSELLDDLSKLAPNYMAKFIPFKNNNDPNKIRELLNDITGNNYPLDIEVEGRRVTAIPDKEGKTRAIAIGEYFTQSILKPVHDKVLGYLRDLPQDMTYNQNGHPKKFGSDLHSYHSLDLANATDRFPISIQKIVIEELTGSKEQAELWARIMTGYKFTNRSPDGSITELKYSVGQPMGFYSSWPVFALTHHMITMYAAEQEGFLNYSFRDYLLLGDDICIKHDGVANRYRSILKKIGVEVSEAKTIISKKLFEFAKRVYLDGMDVSPIPGWSLHLANSSTELAGSLAEIFKRFDFLPIPDQIHGIIGHICGNSPQRVKLLGSAHKLVPLLVEFPVSYDGIGRRNIDNKKLVNFLNMIFPGLPCWPLNIYEELLLLLMFRAVQDNLLPGLQRMTNKYDTVMNNIRSISHGLPGQDPPFQYSHIPLFQVIKNLNNEVSNTVEKVMRAWDWDLYDPIPFRSLSLVDPVKLSQERAHLQILGTKADLASSMRREGKRMTADVRWMKSEDIHDQWIQTISEPKDYQVL